MYDWSKQSSVYSLCGLQFFKKKSAKILPQEATFIKNLCKQLIFR